MKVWMMWHGGSSYGAPDAFSRRDCEPFDSLADAKRSFYSRVDFDPHYPCVTRDQHDDGGPMAWIFADDPFEHGDLQPDWLIEFGPRGGVRCCRC